MARKRSRRKEPQPAAQHRLIDSQTVKGAELAARVLRLLDWVRTGLVTTCTSCVPADQPGLGVIPRRWVVEQTCAWRTAARPVTTNPTAI